MKCENLQFNLSLYSDDCLSETERALTDAHLVQCPLCRQKAADFQILRNSLRGLARPEIPDNILELTRNAVAVEIRTLEPSRSFSYSEYIKHWLMPYSVGVGASLLVAFSFFWAVFSGIKQSENLEIARLQPPLKSTVMLTDKRNSNGDSLLSSTDFELSPRDFANARLSVSGDSPSINPAGALIELTKSFVRGKIKDDEVTVVADVFGNGLAQITEIVEAPRDEETLNRLDKALKTDANFAPFVPASFDNRADSVRVVLKIQRVDIIDTKQKRRRR